MGGDVRAGGHALAEQGVRELRLFGGRHPRAAEASAQATVEAAVTLPVLIVLALIAVNLMMFCAAVARFDRLAPDIVIARAASPAGDEGGSRLLLAGEVASALEGAMGGYGVEVAVEEGAGESEPASALSVAGSLATYVCTMTYEPWPRGISIAGVDFDAPVKLVHERAVTIDPWKSGVVM